MRNQFVLASFLVAGGVALSCSGSDFTGASSKQNNPASTGTASPTPLASQGAGTGTEPTSSDPNSSTNTNIGAGSPTTIYVPVGGSRVLPSTAACSTTDSTVATCSSDIVTGVKLGTTTASAGGTPTTVVVYDPNNPPAAVTASGVVGLPTTAAQLIAIDSGSIDASCDSPTPTVPTNASSFIFSTKTSLANPLASTCENGFEINNTSGTLTLTSTAGSRAVTLAIDVAAYLQPNFFRIQASGPLGQNITVLDSCRLRTSCYGDPTTGICRPPEDSIRSFNLTIPAGTQSLTFYFDNSSPYYLRVLGLCDFGLSQIAGFPSQHGGGSARLISGPTASTVCGGSLQSAAGWDSPQPISSGASNLSCQ